MSLLQSEVFHDLGTRPDRAVTDSRQVALRNPDFLGRFRLAEAFRHQPVDRLKKANELLKKGLGVDLQILSNREKTQLVDALKDTYRLPELLAQLQIARSSYFYHRTSMCLADKYAAVRHSLAEIFEANRRCYGYRRLQASLARKSVIMSERVVQRLMKQEHLVVARQRRRHFGSYLGEISPAPENLINRDFHSKAPNVNRVQDPSWEGVSFAHHRLLRRHGHQLVDWNATRRRAGQYYAGCSY